MSSAKDAVATMGDVLPADAGGRDAVHVAVFSAICSTTLYPCQHVGILGETGEKGDYLVGSQENPQIGIVDPFIRRPVSPGERFWVFLYPRTITGLCHRWTHPAFEESNTTYARPAEKIDSEKWLRDFCERADVPGYERTMDALHGVKSKFFDDYLIFQGVDAGGEIPPEFWEHAEKVTGIKFDKRPKYFSCSC